MDNTLDLSMVPMKRNLLSSKKPANFRVGTNHIAILANTVGLPDSGAYMEHRYAGPKSILILGLNTGILDLTTNNWGLSPGTRQDLPPQKETVLLPSE